MRFQSLIKYGLLIVALLVTAAIYWPGLSGYFLFDDFPNIVDNKGVQPSNASIPSLVDAALSSPSSEFSRPLASLSFAVNYLVTGLDPYWMKLTNLLIHLLNGFLVFVLSKALLQAASSCYSTEGASDDVAGSGSYTARKRTISRSDLIALLISTSWMLLPINLTAVLYVVQRMESMANLFVLLGLIGYIKSRRMMLAAPPHTTDSNLLDMKGPVAGEKFWSDHAFILCSTSLILTTAIGVLVKETAAMLPLYAVTVEWAVFHFHKASPLPTKTHTSDVSFCDANSENRNKASDAYDKRIIYLFLLVLVLPAALGLAWLVPKVLSPQSWITRDFTLSTRLLSEARIVADYIIWTLLPAPHDLSFYHDDFAISAGLLTPWTTLASMMALAALAAFAFWIRAYRPLVALGIALYLGCHLLTGTIIPLELIYEHRNYFASFGLLLALIPLLAAPRAIVEAQAIANTSKRESDLTGSPAIISSSGLPFMWARYLIIIGLITCWSSLTAMTAYSWGNPLLLAAELARRAPESPRAQYELGRAYIIATGYNPSSPFTHLVYAPLERAAALPNSSILPEQAMIFMNARMRLPSKDAWWSSLIAKLEARPPTVQDESSLASLTECARTHDCDLPKDRMIAAFQAALSHARPSARLLANYGDYAWNVLDDRPLGLRMTEASVSTEPNEPAYHITLTRMLVVLGRFDEALRQIAVLNKLNYGGRLNASITELRELPGLDEYIAERSKSM